VAVFLSKEEQYLQYHKERLDTYYKVGLKKDGTVVALDGKVTGDAGAYNYSASVTKAVTYLVTQANFPNMRFAELGAAFTNNPPGGGCRGWLYLEGQLDAGYALLKAAAAL
jgi:CO/xanthine dehydrogenase Mo-binding subunit